MHFLGFTKPFRTIFTSVHIIHIFIVLNDDILDIEKPDVICSHNYVEDEFSGLFLH